MVLGSITRIELPKPAAWVFFAVKAERGIDVFKLLTIINGTLVTVVPFRRTDTSAPAATVFGPDESIAQAAVHAAAGNKFI